MVSSLEVTDRESQAVAVAPRVTLQSMEEKIAETEYVVHKNILTIAIVTMKSGFFVVGKSAPASPENFNAELGKKFAREDAIRQLWGYEGYLLRDRLSQMTTDASGPA